MPHRPPPHGPHHPGGPHHPHHPRQHNDYGHYNSGDLHRAGEMLRRLFGEPAGTFLTRRLESGMPAHDRFQVELMLNTLDVAANPLKAKGSSAPFAHLVEDAGIWAIQDGHFADVPEGLRAPLDGTGWHDRVPDWFSWVGQGPWHVRVLSLLIIALAETVQASSTTMGNAPAEGAE